MKLGTKQSLALLMIGLWEVVLPLQVNAAQEESTATQVAAEKAETDKAASSDSKPHDASQQQPDSSDQNLKPEQQKAPIETVENEKPDDAAMQAKSSSDVREIKSSVGLRAGLFGVGFEVSKPVLKEWDLRLSAYGFSYNYQEKKQGLTYDFEHTLSATGLLMDWHPFRTPFRFALGIYSNSSDIDGVVKEADSYEIGANEYSATQTGEVRVAADVGNTAPYVGVGWGYGRKDIGLGFILDAGILIQESPKVRMWTSNLSQLDDATAQQLRRDLSIESKQMKTALNEFEFYAVINFGISFAF